MEISGSIKWISIQSDVNIIFNLLSNQISLKVLQIYWNHDADAKEEDFHGFEGSFFCFMRWKSLSNGWVVGREEPTAKIIPENSSTPSNRHKTETFSKKIVPFRSYYLQLCTEA